MNKQEKTDALRARMEAKEEAKEKMRDLSLNELAQIFGGRSMNGSFEGTERYPICNTILS